MEDTIAQISTPLGTGGISIIRISGSESINILSKVFKGKKDANEIKSHTINYGNIVNSENKVIDEVLVSVMYAPNTYTKENVVEINCHGGIKTVQTVLLEVLKNGARLADAGEFTKRAFLNGRLDLSQAEAVIDVINAKTNLQQEVALNQLKGSLSNEIINFRQAILRLLAQIEASIDYPEHDMEENNLLEIEKEVKDLKCKVQNLVDTSDTGKILREGIQTVILGKPNVGKSSLLNVLLNEDRAIVTDVAGTTRDILQEYVNIKDIALKIIDTAGIRDTEDKIEKIGVQRSKEYALKADLVLLVLDGSRELEEEDIEIMDFIKNKKSIILINKNDLDPKINLGGIKQENIINISTLNKDGLDLLIDEIRNLFFKGEINTNDEMFICSLRHKGLLNKAIDSLNLVLTAIEGGFTEDFITIDLMDAYKSLGEIIGETVDEDVIEAIFSEFCLGK